MKLPTLLTQYTQNTSIELVFSCAWCPKETEKALKPQQEYTHGMCQQHKELFIAKVKERVSRIGQREGISLMLPKTV